MADLTIKDYQDWLKNNKSVKVAKEGEELSKYDEQKNRALYQEYLNEAQLYNDKKTQEALIDQNKRDALRDNYIAQAQAQKNAGDVMKAAKMTTGLSESSLVDLYARGAQARADIMKQSAAQKVDLLSKYNQGIADVKASTNSKFAEIDALRYQDEEAKKAEEEAKKAEKDATDKLYASTHFADLLTKFNNDEIDFEELQGAYETLGAHFDDVENYDIINEYKKHLKDNEDVEAIQASKDALADEGVKASDDVRSLDSIDTIDKGYLGVTDDRLDGIKKELKQAIQNGYIKDGETIIVALSDDLMTATYYKDGKLFQGSSFDSGFINGDFRMLKNAIYNSDGTLNALKGLAKDTWNDGKFLLNLSPVASLFNIDGNANSVENTIKLITNEIMQRADRGKFVGE